MAAYCGTYYTLSNERIPFHKDKTEDDRFFVLTLIAIAEEITARGIGEKEQQHIQLAVGLPPAHFGSQAEKFTAYFQGRGLVEFMYGDKHYAISIEDVACYPQAYAAAATMLHALLDDPKAVVLDIGGFTADYLLLKNGKADLASCDSLENGVIIGDMLLKRIAVISGKRIIDSCNTPIRRLFPTVLEKRRIDALMASFHNSYLTMRFEGV